MNAFEKQAAEAVDRLGESLAELHGEKDKLNDLTPDRQWDVRATVKKASRAAELTYLSEMSPDAAAVWEANHPEAEDSSGLRDSEAILTKAAELRKNDLGMSVSMSVAHAQVAVLKGK